MGKLCGINEERCVGCGACAKVCPNQSRKPLLFTITTDELVEALRPQLGFFRDSGGGVTFSGGEATSQKEFLREAASRLYDMGIDLALETCGYFDFDALAPTLKLFQLIFFDLKHMDDRAHRRHTGCSNQLILANLPRLAELAAQVVVRVPAIIGVNADAENIRATARFVKERLPKARIELLPYHNYGEIKYEALGLASPDAAWQAPSEEELSRLESIIEREGIATVRFR